MIRTFSRKQWKRIYRKLRVRVGEIRRKQLWEQGYAMLQSIHAEIADKLQASQAADWKMDRIIPSNW